MNESSRGTETYFLWLLCFAEDFAFSDSLKKVAEEILRSKVNVPSEFITYKGTTHGKSLVHECANMPNFIYHPSGLDSSKGFAARPNMSIPEVKEGFHSAFNQTVNWFKLHLLNA
jgi:hypothetical protein